MIKPKKVRSITKKNDLATCFPTIAAEWDYKLNGSLTPRDVAAHSSKKAHWNCSVCGNTWMAVIGSRTKGHGCPYCSGLLPIVGKTDLATRFPAIAAEWDYSQNGSLTPGDVAGYSNKKAHWICNICGNRWTAMISNRSKGDGCPYCAGKIPIVGKTDLATCFPEVAAEWDYKLNGSLTPEQVTAYSHKKIHWRCIICNNGWIKAVAKRSLGYGCPYCAGKLPIVGKTDLATCFPKIAAEWDYKLNGSLTPEQVTVRSGKKVYWRCSVCSNGWTAIIASRTSGSGCPYCAGKLPIVGKTDLATCFPEVAAEWDYKLNGSLTPEQVTIRSHKKVHWRCSVCSNGWTATIASRTYGRGCPYCARKILIVGKTDLATCFPKIAAEWDYSQNGSLTPGDVAAHSNKKAHWLCRVCGNTWMAIIGNRTNGHGCPYCSGLLPIVGKTDLATRFPAIAAEWDYSQNGSLTPEQVTPRSGKKVHWICSSCGNEWMAVIGNRTSSGGRCPYCTGKISIARKQI